MESTAKLSPWLYFPMAHRFSGWWNSELLVQSSDPMAGTDACKRRTDTTSDGNIARKSFERYALEREVGPRFIQQESRCCEATLRFQTSEGQMDQMP